MVVVPNWGERMAGSFQFVPKAERDIIIIISYYTHSK